MKKHFVTFFSPGTLFSEEETRPIDSWDVDAACKMAATVTARHDQHPYAFQFTTRERSDSDLDSRQTAKSGRYFFEGTIETLPEVEERIGNESILAINMRSNGWERVITCYSPSRITQPLLADDVVLS